MLIQLGKHHKIFGISTKVNSISCPNDNIYFSLVHMLDLDIIVAGIDNIHATNCIFWEIRFSGILNLGGESDLRYSLLTMTTQVARFPQTPTTRKMLKVKYCFFVFHIKELYWVAWVLFGSAQKHVFIAMHLIYGIKSNVQKRGHLKLKRTGLQEKAQGWIEMKIKAFLSLMRF